MTRSRNIRTFDLFDEFPDVGPNDLPRLFQKLEAADSLGRDAICDLISDTGEAAFPHLASLLSHSDDDLRWHAVHAAQDIDSPNPAKLELLTAALHDSSESVRLSAALGISRMGVQHPVAVAQITEALELSLDNTDVNDYDAECSIVDFATALGEFNRVPPYAVALLVRCLDTGSFHVRVAALLALATHGNADDGLARKIQAIVDNPTAVGEELVEYQRESQRFAGLVALASVRQNGAVDEVIAALECETTHLLIKSAAGIALAAMPPRFLNTTEISRILACSLDEDLVRRLQTELAKREAEQ